jgi:hypothetical protein
MLPATAVLRPAARHRTPVRAVVVVLPLLPVIAITCARGDHWRRPQCKQFDLGKQRNAKRHRLPESAVPASGRRERWRSDQPRQRLPAQTGRQTRSPRARPFAAQRFAVASRDCRRHGPRPPAVPATWPSPVRFRRGRRRVSAFPEGPCQRSFRVDRPTSTSMMVMIQKRTTTCVSFQPPSSKWWCSGAMRKIRRPPVHR